MQLQLQQAWGRILVHPQIGRTLNLTIVEITYHPAVQRMRTPFELPNLPALYRTLLDLQNQLDGTFAELKNRMASDGTFSER